MKQLNRLFLLSALTALISTAGCRPQPAAVNSTPPAAPATFVDIARQAGLNYAWTITAKRPLNILQTIGNGCAFLDYNNDGNLDILLVGPRVALYRGDGKGHFTDVTAQTGLDKLHGNFLGCAVGDYDNDGYDDIYLSAYRGGVLLHNDHGKRFVDVTKAAGIAPQPWGTSCEFVDVDNDGKLDLFIGNYIRFGPSTVPQLCRGGSEMTACGPRMYAPEFGVLYRNIGGGKFVDATKKLGFDKIAGKDLGVSSVDLDGSGKQSVYIANDLMAGNLMSPSGSTFKDIAGEAGCAFDSNARAHSGMGIDWGDYDNDGRFDLLVTTFENETKCVYHNDGAGLFTEVSGNLNLTSPTLANVAFGAKWIDYDNDGWLDIMIANGHIADNVNDYDKSTTYRQPVQLFHNDHGARFADTTSSLQSPANRPIVGRGLAVGDYDNDGKMDALVVDAEGTPMLLHNVTAGAGHWLEVNLQGTKSNRDGQGAVLNVAAGGQHYTMQCTTAGSYMSASDKRVHFGLGSATTVDTLTVHWPSGHIDTYKNIPADKFVDIREGAQAPTRVL